MWITPPKLRYVAMTNTERQRQFRKRNPGYYGRLHRKRKAKVDAHLLAAAAAKQSAAVAEVAVAPAAVEPVAIPQPAIVYRYLPALPAPALQPMFEDRATIPTRAELQAEREAAMLIKR